MKVAVSSAGETLDSAIDPRFGRASGFILVDTETGEHETIDNAQNLDAAQGAGIQAAQTVASHAAECVITGHCGPKAFRALESAGIKVALVADGTVAEAIDRLKAGDIQISDCADVEGHWAQVVRTYLDCIPCFLVQALSKPLDDDTLRVLEASAKIAGNILLIGDRLVEHRQPDTVASTVQAPS